MKKIIAFLLSIVICFSMAGCKKKGEEQESKPDFDISVNFSFYKDGNKKVPFEGSVFNINTRIYVCVDFTITKNVEVEEVISFEVQIPYAEYYSTKDYYAGTIKPHENLKTEQDLHGNEYTIMILDQMRFVIDDNESHDFHYIFEIEANQVCDSAEFIVRFKPDNWNLKLVVVNGIKDNKAKTTYTFKAEED